MEQITTKDQGVFPKDSVDYNEILTKLVLEMQELNNLLRKKVHFFESKFDYYEEQIKAFESQVKYVDNSTVNSKKLIPR